MNQKFKKLLFLFLVLFLIIPMQVFAAEELVLSVDKKDLKAGDQVVVTARASEKLATYAILATLKYDQNVFQVIDDTNFNLTDTTSITYNKTNHKFGIINRTGSVASDGELFSLRLKVKENANIGETNIALTNISSSDGHSKISIPTTSVKLLVTRNVTGWENVPTNPENDISEDAENIITVFTTTPVIITLGVATLLLLIALIYVILKKKNKKVVIGLISLEAIVLTTMGVLLYLNNSKKDVNNDGVRDYNDAEEIIKYLIDVEGSSSKDEETSEDSSNNSVSQTPSNNKQTTNNQTSSSNNQNNNSNNGSDKTPNKPDGDYDTNNDGKVDIEDAGHIAEETTKNTTVKLEEYLENQSYYLPKGETTLAFIAEINPQDVTIKQVKIGDELYPVTYDSGVYYVNVSTPDGAGEFDFVIQEVILDNGKTVKTNYKITKEILKDVPTVDMFNLDDESKSLSFNLDDPEDAFIKGVATIYDGEEILASAEVESYTEFKNLALEVEKDYTIKIVGSYDLDSNKEDSENAYTDELMFVHSFRTGGNYNFVLNNLAITDAIQPDEKPVISFTSSNVRNAQVVNAIVTNDEHKLTYTVLETTENNYEVVLEHADTTPGSHTVMLDNVGLDSLKTFENKKDYDVNELTYVVLKEAPKAENLQLVDHRDTHNIEATFRLNDPHQAVSKIVVSLVDSTNTIASQKEYTEAELKDIQDNTFNLLLAYDNKTDGVYKVIVYADYALTDKYFYSNVNIGEKDILSPKDIHIRNMYLINKANEKVTSPYIEKDDLSIALAMEIVIGDDIKNYRSYGGISYITINGLNCPISTLKTPDKNDGAYLLKVLVKMPTESGVFDLKTNRLQLSNNGYYHIYSDYFSFEEQSLTIEVLKDKPEIKNLKVVEEDYENGKVTFDFDVVVDNTAKEGDNSFTSGILTLDGQEGTPSVVNTPGTHRVTFENVAKDKALDLIFNAKYDLDSNTLDTDKNEHEENIFHEKYTLYNPETYQDGEIIDGSTNKQYYEKNEKITLDFDIKGGYEELGMTPKKVVVNNQEYDLVKTDNGYQTTINGYYSSGQKEIVLTDVIFDYGQKVNLNKSYSFKVEVLKDAIKLNNLEYTLEDENIKINFSENDPDKALVKAKIDITDEVGTSLYSSDYKSEVIIPRNPNIVRYFVKVTGDYDRDINKSAESENYSKNVTLLDEIISLDQNNIELKDIIDINLYKYQKNGVYDEIVRVDEISYSELSNHLDDYFVEVVMENLPSIRSRVKETIERDNYLYLVLDLAYVTKEGKVRSNEVMIPFGEIQENGIAINEFHPDLAIKKLINDLNNNKDITLNQNYDFSKINIEGDTYIASYQGTLDGNGFTFKNLDKPLFDMLTGKVKNLKIKDVTFGSNGHGALANKANNAEVINVLADNIQKTAGGSGQNGGLLGAIEKTKVDQCRVTNVVLNVNYLDQQNGLLIGSTNGGVDVSVVSNSYAEGKINSGWNFTNGFIGECKSTTVKNNYVKVTAGSHVSGMGDAWHDANSVYENNISIGIGTGTTMIGNSKARTNNYYYVDKEATDADGVTIITKEEINDELFLKKAQFDPNIWYIKDVTFDNLPIFNSEIKSVLKDTSSEDYKNENETLYYNLTKLMPFYDSNKIINVAKNVTDVNLTTKTIKHIMPFDSNDNLVTYLTTEDKNKIKRIRVAFTDNSKVDYSVQYDKTYDMVATYRIRDLSIDYNYRNYIIDANSQIIGNLTKYLEGLDYKTNLDILTTNKDHQIYQEFYNEVTRKELREFVLKYLANSGYANTGNDSTINNYLEREIKKDKNLEKVLYTYNYFRRFYDVEVGNMKLYDLMMFGLTEFNEELTPLKIANLYFGDNSGANFSTAATSTKYDAVLGPYTKIDNLANFLEYVVTTFSDEDNMAHWVKEQFKGILVEIPVENEPDIQYTLWDHFKNRDKNYTSGVYGHWSYEFILPILTLPEDAAYIISCPVEFIIGAQRTYMSDPTDAQQVANFKVKLESYTSRLKNYFNTAYGILQDKTLFNNMHLFIIDKRNTKNLDGTATYNTPNSTTEPFHKNFNDLVNLWPAAAGNNAAAWGYYIEMQVAGVLDSTLATDGTLDEGHVTYKTLTHESAHNLDDRLFFKNNGQRGGGEDYADAFLMQAFEKYGIVMNLSINFDLDKLKAKNQAVGTNLTPERINTEAKISDFYKKVFETIYTVDYLEAQAFLQLTPAEQQKLAVQISYPNADLMVKFVDANKKEYTEYVGADGEKYPVESKTYKEDPYAQNAAYSITQYTKLTEIENFDYSKLKTIDDLIDNKIMLYPGKEKVSTLGPGRYGGEGYNVAHWYQPHNDYGFPDSYSFKWISYEMLGYAGYTKGFVEYASNTNTTKRTFYSNPAVAINKDNGRLALTEVNYKSDASALNTITGGKYDDFDKYKKMRFAEIKDKLNNLNSVVKAKEYVQEFYDALKKDAANEKTAISLANSIEVRFKLYDTLKNYTHDFTDDVYLKTWQQDASNLEVTK